MQKYITSEAPNRVVHHGKERPHTENKDPTVDPQIPTNNRYQILTDDENTTMYSLNMSNQWSKKQPEFNRSRKSSFNTQKRQRRPPEKVNIMYVNPMGITGKISSLTAVANSCDTQIICLAETKLGNTTPRVQGFSLFNKPKKP